MSTGCFLIHAGDKPGLGALRDSLRESHRADPRAPGATAVEVVLGGRLSICNAEGGPLAGSPAGPVCSEPHRRVATSLCARGTRPRPRLAPQPAAGRRGHPFSVNTP
jgi:hypothetical protein